MLASITPLGERSRNSKWTTTVIAYIAGATGAAALVGGVLGAIGAYGVDPHMTPRVAFAALAAAALLGAILDSRLFGLKLPTIHRQVDDAWLYRYRSWFYGFGFGSQLGTGVVTIVNSSLTYVALLSEILAGTAARGLVIGVVFGLARSAVILSGARIQDASQLNAFHRYLAAWDVSSRWATYAAQGALGIAAIVTAIR